MTVIHLVQHAEKQAVPMDPGLTERGRLHAAATGIWAGESGVRTLITSPLRRARETAGFMATATGLVVIEAAAGGKRQLDRFVEQIGDRIADPYYQPRDNGDAIAHWIEDDCWRAPSPPPTTFPAAPGHRKPSQLVKAQLTGNDRIRHEKAIMWFTRRRRPGNVILHHRTVNPVLIREWSIAMDNFAGSIWNSQRTTKRFKPNAR